MVVGFTVVVGAGLVVVVVGFGRVVVVVGLGLVVVVVVGRTVVVGAIVVVVGFTVVVVGFTVVVETGRQAVVVVTAQVVVVEHFHAGESGVLLCRVPRPTTAMPTATTACPAYFMLFLAPGDDGTRARYHTE